MRQERTKHEVRERFFKNILDNFFRKDFQKYELLALNTSAGREGEHSSNRVKGRREMGEGICDASWE